MNVFELNSPNFKKKGKKKKFKRNLLENLPQSTK